MIKITGLDQLTHQLDEAQKALAELDGELGAVSFNPSDPASIEAAIQNVELLVDEKLGEYSDNPIIGPLAMNMKECYRDAIIGRAATARLEGVAEQ